MIPRVDGPDGHFVLKVFGSDKYFIPTAYEANEKSIIYQREGEKWIEKSLNFEVKELIKIKAAAVSKKNIVVLEQTHKQIYVYPNYELHFRLKVFDREQRKLLRSVFVGKVYIELMGPWVSSVQIHDGYAYFSWTELVDKKRYLVSYNFTRVHLESGKIETRSVAKGGGNTVPSFGILNDTVLFAYHEPQTRMLRKTFEKVP